MLTLHGGGTEVGAVNAARSLPYLLFGLVAGVLIDRVRRLPVLITTDLGRGLLLLAVPLLVFLDRLSLVWLTILMAAFRLMSLLNAGSGCSSRCRAGCRAVACAAKPRKVSPGSIGTPPCARCR